MQFSLKCCLLSALQGQDLLFQQTFLVLHLADRYVMLFPNAEGSMTPFSLFPFCLTASLIILWGLSLLWLWSEERKEHSSQSLGAVGKGLRCLIYFLWWLLKHRKLSQFVLIPNSNFTCSRYSKPVPRSFCCAVL